MWMTGPVRDQSQCRWRHELREHRREDVPDCGADGLRRAQSVQSCHEKLGLATMVDVSRDAWEASEVTKVAVTMPTSTQCCSVLAKGERGTGRACTCCTRIKASHKQQKIVEGSVNVCLRGRPASLVESAYEVMEDRHRCYSPTETSRRPVSRSLFDMWRV